MEVIKSPLTKNEKRRVLKMKLLLEIYNCSNWRIEQYIIDNGDTFDLKNEQSIRDIAYIINLNDIEKEYESLKNYLNSNKVNINTLVLITKIIDNTLSRMSSYPDNGNLYYQILSDSFIKKPKLSNCEIRSKYNIAHTTFHRYKNEGFKLMANIMIEYILPALIEECDIKEIKVDTQIHRCKDCKNKKLITTETNEKLSS